MRFMRIHDFAPPTPKWGIKMQLLIKNKRLVEFK